MRGGCWRCWCPGCSRVCRSRWCPRDMEIERHFSRSQPALRWLVRQSHPSIDEPGSLGYWASLDQPVGPGDDGRRHGHSEDLGGLEVEDKFEARRLLDREIGRFRATKQLLGVARKMYIGLALIRAVAHQSPGVGILAPAEHRRQPLRDGELGDLGPVP